MIKTDVLRVVEVRVPAKQAFELPMCTSFSIERSSDPLAGRDYASVGVTFGSKKYFMDSCTLRAWAEKFEAIAQVLEEAIRASQG